MPTPISRPLVALGVGYLFAGSLMMAVERVVLTPGYLLFLAVPLALLAGSWVRVLAEWSPLAAVVSGWEAMRNLAPSLSLKPSYGILQPELWLFNGHLPTVALQSALHQGPFGHQLDALATAVYIGYFPAMLGVGVVLWFRDRSAFVRYTTALVAVGLVAYSLFLLLPSAPPWLAAQHGMIHGLTRVFTETLPDPVEPYLQALNPDPVAAIPSLHAAIPLLGFFSLRRTLPRFSLVLLAWSVTVWFCVVYLGEHYVLDVAAGILLAVVLWRLLERSWQAQPTEAGAPRTHLRSGASG